MVLQISPGIFGPLDKRFVAFGPGAVVGKLPSGISIFGPLANFFGFGAKVGAKVAKVGPAAVPKTTAAIRTVSTLGKTRAGLNLSGRTVFAIGAGTAATGFTAFSIDRLTQPGPSGSSPIEIIVRGAEDIAEDVGPGFENVTKFLQQNGPIIALAIGGIVLIGLIK